MNPAVFPVIGGNGDTISFDVITNGTLRVDTNDPWIHFDTAAGIVDELNYVDASLGTSVSVVIDVYSTGTPRQGMIIITGPCDICRAIAIEQTALNLQ